MRGRGVVERTQSSNEFPYMTNTGQIPDRVMRNPLETTPYDILRMVFFPRVISSGAMRQQRVVQQEGANSLNHL